MQYTLNTNSVTLFRGHRQCNLAIAPLAKVALCVRTLTGLSNVCLFIANFPPPPPRDLPSPEPPRISRDWRKIFEYPIRAQKYAQFDMLDLVQLYCTFKTAGNLILMKLKA